MGQREMAQMIVDGLRPQFGHSHSVGSGLQDPGNDGDIEDHYSRPGPRTRGGPKRRNNWENVLSVSFSSLVFWARLTRNQQKVRGYMLKIVTPAHWMKNRVTREEVNAFNPGLGPCCDTANFRLHLEGTPCDAWNKSATGVFVNGFLVAHPEYPSQEEPVREMVRMKSHATLESMIREYRKSKIPLTEAQVEELRLQKNRQEHKRKVVSLISHPPTVSDSCASFMIAAALLRSCTRLLGPSILFWTNSGLLGCPVTRSEL